MRKIIFAFILFQMLFVSCKKINWDSEIFLCGATINGASCKDVTTLYKDLFEGLIMPFNNKKRIQIERDSIAYLQFRLVSCQDPKVCFYIYGGIAFDKNEAFPLVNKIYNISYDSKLDREWMFYGDELRPYMAEHRSQGTMQSPYGVMMLLDYKEPGEEGYGNYSLSGTLVFTSYNPKNQKCVGHFKLSNEHIEGMSNVYSVEGQFNANLFNWNKKIM